MDITTLAAWGEFLGGVVVIFSLIYLAGQILHTKSQIEANTNAVLGASEIKR